jgi:molybdopterin molybdotransferase
MAGKLLNNGMISLETAQELVLSKAVQVNPEQVELTDSLGRVLAEDIIADVNMPPFHKSAVDGFACRKEDVSNPLEVIENIPAGYVSEKKIGLQQCARIMTGAMIPEGADMVIMLEHTEKLDESHVIFTGTSPKSNICYLGEDVKTGQKMLPAGTRLKPQHLAILAAAGCTRPLVSRTLRAGVIVTGDELVEPDQKPTGSKIRNSNAWQLIGQLKKKGVETNYYGIVADIFDEIKNIINKSLQQNDLTIITGGASKGDFDYVPEILEDLGLVHYFEKVAIQPGKPVSFAVGGGKICFGLSGNPVSSFFQFELLVAPFILKMEGVRHPSGSVVTYLTKDMERKKTERMQFFPVSMNENGQAEPLEFHGSAHIAALARADGMVAFPVGVDKLDKKDPVHVRPV